MAKRRTLKAQLQKEKQRAEALQKENSQLKSACFYLRQCADAVENIQSVKCRHEWTEEEFDNLSKRRMITMMLHDMIDSDEGYAVFDHAVVGDVNNVIKSKEDRRHVIVSEIELFMAIPRMNRLGLSEYEPKTRVVETN